MVPYLGYVDAGVMNIDLRTLIVFAVIAVYLVLSLMCFMCVIISLQVLKLLGYFLPN